MSAIIEFLLVGRAPLGSAIRAAILGALAVTVGRAFFSGWWAPLVFGVVLSLVVLALAYMISRRDNEVDPYLAAQDEAPPPASPRDLYGDDDRRGGPPGSHL